MDGKSEDVANDNGVDTKFINYKQLPDEVVISGMSGRLPQSSTIQEFKENLFNSHDMVNDEPKHLNGLSAHSGKIKDSDLQSFDYKFFGMDEKQAELMDPQMRMLLESTYESIIDAGFHPQELRATQTSIYIGISRSDVDDSNSAKFDSAEFANRISSVFDFMGPSYAVDKSNASSMYAMSQAFTDLKAGHCDAAIVAGLNLMSSKPERSGKYLSFTLPSDFGVCFSTFCFPFHRFVECRWKM